MYTSNLSPGFLQAFCYAEGITVYALRLQSSRARNKALTKLRPCKRIVEHRDPLMPADLEVSVLSFFLPEPVFFLSFGVFLLCGSPPLLCRFPWYRYRCWCQGYCWCQCLTQTEYQPCHPSDWIPTLLHGSRRTDKVGNGILCNGSRLHICARLGQ
jgi:hypothetical protein